MRLLLLLLLTGCATTPSATWSPAPIIRVEFPEHERPTAAEPATVPREGRVELDADVGAYLLDTSEMYPIAHLEYDRCVDSREADIAEAKALLQALEVQRAEARKGQWRAAAVGAGAGAGAVLAVVLGVVLGTR